MSTPSRTMSSTSKAVCRFCGYGMPWLMMVLSSATTACRSRSAFRTSGCTTIPKSFCKAFCNVQGRLACMHVPTLRCHKCMFALKNGTIMYDDSYCGMNEDHLRMSLCTCAASLLLIAEYAVVTRDAAP